MNLKLALGGGFVVAAIFWAGATYNRMGNMETSLTEIKVSLGILSEMPLLRLRVNTLEGENQDFKRRLLHLELKNPALP